MSVRGAKSHGVVWTDRWNKKEIEPEFRSRFPHLLPAKTNYTPGTVIEGCAFQSGFTYVITGTPESNEWNSPKRYAVWGYAESIQGFGEFRTLAEACLHVQRLLIGGFLE
jgi:hypothetical protein